MKTCRKVGIFVFSIRGDRLGLNTGQKSRPPADLVVARGTSIRLGALASNGSIMTVRTISDLRLVRMSAPKTNSPLRSLI
jgi:hypothetical protein